MGMQADSTFFLDTNILLIATDESRSLHNEAKGLFSRVQQAGAHLAISGQVLREYLVVATRPTHQNGLGLSSKDALENVKEFQQRTVFCDEPEKITARLFKLISALSITGKRIHDANIAATMAVHGITFLITQNTYDFKGFEKEMGIKLFSLTDIS